MRICKVWDSEYPWDVRVEKVCQSLVGAGHEVTLVCRNRRREASREHVDGVAIRRLPRIGGRLNGALSFPAFFNPLWLAAIGRAVREQRSDVLLVRDLPLALAGLLVGRSTGRPVVLDFAEHYPAMLEDFWPVNRRRPHTWVTRHPRLARVIERVAVRRADHILVVVQEAMDRLRALGVDDDRLSIVTNTPSPERLRHVEPDARPTRPAGGGFELVYLGFLDVARGVDVAVRALPAIAAAIPAARLTIVGTGDQEASLRALARELDVADRVTFAGWVPYRRAQDLIADATVGLVPHRVTEAWSATVPNKLFDYMAAGKPVVASNTPPVRRIVETERCGLLFRDRDAADLAAQVIRLAEPALRRRLGANGRQAVVERYNWASDEKALLAALERVGRPVAAPVGGF